MCPTCSGSIIKQGNNIIADDVFYFLPGCIDILEKFKPVIIGIYCPLEILEERELTRNDVTAGSARSDYSSIHKPGIYDLKLDTSGTSPHEAAQEIKKYLETYSEPQAYAQLKSHFLNKNLN